MYKTMLYMPAPLGVTPPEQATTPHRRHIPPPTHLLPLDTTPPATLDTTPGHTPTPHRRHPSTPLRRHTSRHHRESNSTTPPVHPSIPPNRHTWTQLRLHTLRHHHACTPRHHPPEHTYATPNVQTENTLPTPVDTMLNGWHSYSGQLETRS